MITLLQLDYFRKLAATEHITKTAKDLYISQTALSSMIIGLERELGVQLFDRSKRKIQLNAAGRLYLKYVNDIFCALDSGHAALQDMAYRKEQEIRIAVGASLVWVPLFRDFHKAFPDYTLKQVNSNAAELHSAVAEMAVDFVLAGEGDFPTDGLQSAWIRDNETYLCVPPDSKYANYSSVFLSQVKDEPFINLPVGTPWRSYCDKLFTQAGYTVHPVLECDYTMRASLVASGFGIALTSSSALDVDLLHPNRYIRIADEFATRRMLIFWNPKRYMSYAAQDFLHFCTTYWNTPDGAQRES